MRKLSEETRRKMSEAHKGKLHTEEEKQKIAEAHLGKSKPKHSKEHNRKIGQSQKGKVLSEETKRKMSEVQKGRVVSEETRQKLREANLGKKQSEEANQKRREAMQLLKDNPDYRSKVSRGVRKAYENPEFREKQQALSTSSERLTKLQEGRKNHVFTLEEREVKRQQMLDRWQNDNGVMLEQARSVQPGATRASQEVQMSSLEVQVKGLFDVLGIRYEQQKPIGIYTADFFLSDHNLVIEVYGCYWHACPACGYSYPKKNGYDKRREAYIKACGYNLFILWEHDLMNELDINSLIERKE